MSSRLIILLLVCSSPALSIAQEPAKDEEAPKAVTTSDLEIPVDQLQLKLKPLMVDELKVEADAWMEVLKAKTTQITSAQLGVKKTNEAVKAAGEDTGEAAKKLKEAEEEEKKKEEAAPAGQDEIDAEKKADAAEEEEPAEGDDGSVAKAEEKKEKLLEDVNALREEQTAIIDRVNTVLDAWEQKGGDPESHRKYIAAIVGIEVDVTDASATWSAIQGWLTSAEGGYRWLKNIVLFVGTILVFWFLAIIAGRMTRQIAGRSENLSEMLQTFLVGFVRKAVLVIGFVMALSMLEINIGPVLAALGALGFIVGFALQGTLSNFASGLMILAYRPFDTGDVVNAGGVTGTVESMTIVSTRFRTGDNQAIVVPNNEIWGGVITNVTGKDTRRVDLVFGIGYEDNMARAEEIINDILAKHELVLKEPAPVVKVHELADSSVNFICRPWTATGDYWTVYWDVTRAVKEAFDAEGISIPFPQQDIHIHQTSPAN